MYSIELSPDELMHFGIKGMHWGVRRYQNKDGSLTSAGRSRYGNSSKVVDRTPSYGSASYEETLSSGRRQSRSSGSSSNEALNQSIKMGKGKENRSPAEQVTSQTDRAVQNSSRTLRGMSDAKKQREKQKRGVELDRELESLSDEELNAVIKRMDMERRYKDLSTQAQTKRNGFDTAADILDVIGGVTSVAASAAVVASTIYMMKH